MAKFFILIALVCLGLASAFGPPGGGHGGPPKGGQGGPPKGGNQGGGWGGNQGGGWGARQWASKLCLNSNSTGPFLTQTQALIAQLTANSTYAAFLQGIPQTLAYFASTANAATLSSNCTQYFNGLDTAFKADMNAKRLQEGYAHSAMKQFSQIVKSLLGTNNNNNDNSSGDTNN